MVDWGSHEDFHPWKKSMPVQVPVCTWKPLSWGVARTSWPPVLIHTKEWLLLSSWCTFDCNKFLVHFTYTCICLVVVTRWQKLNMQSCRIWDRDLTSITSSVSVSLVQHQCHSHWLESWNLKLQKLIESLIWLFIKISTSGNYMRTDLAQTIQYFAYSIVLSLHSSNLVLSYVLS